MPNFRALVLRPMERHTHHSITRFTVIFIALLNLPFAYSQIGNDKLNVTIEAALPSGRANAAYRNYLNGLVSVQPKLQYKFAKAWYGAVGLRYSYYTVSEYKVPKKTNGGENTFGGYVEAGWNKWVGERIGLEIGVKTGVSQHIFTTGLTKETGIQYVTAMFVQPTISFILASDEAVAYRWIIGYNIDGYDFKPYHIGQTSNGGYQPADFNKPSQSFLVGFAFSYYFGNPRSGDEINP